MAESEKPTESPVDSHSNAVERRLFVPEYRVLRDRYATWSRQLVSLVERVSAHSLAPTALVHGLATLQRIADQIDVQLAAFFESESPVQEPESLRRLLMHGETTIRRCEAQLAANEFADAAVETLTGLLHSLLMRPDADGRPLTRLVDELQRAATKQQKCWTFLGETNDNGGIGRRWESSIRRMPTRSRESVPEVLKAGIATAQIAAQILVRQPMLAPTQQRSILTASLLQDIGFVLLERRFRCTPGQLRVMNPQEYARHPRFSAALAEGINGISVDVLRAIGGHHQSRQSAVGHAAIVTQAVAVATRFRELFDGAEGPFEPVGDQREPFGTDRRLQSAMSLLQSEARLGDWNSDLCTALELAVRSCIAPMSNLDGSTETAETKELPSPHFLANLQSVNRPLTANRR